MNRLILNLVTGSFVFGVGITAGCLTSSGGGSSKPRLCVPDGESEVEGDLGETSRECQTCVRRNCRIDDDCSDQCESYYRCTCRCDGDDQACFDDCQDERSRSCERCTQDSTDDLLDCIQDDCADECLSGGGLGGIGDDGGGADDDGWPGDDGWTGGDDGGAGDGGAGDGGAGDGGAGDGGGGGGHDGSAACQELHGSCCPKLSGFDKDLCEGADSQLTCELWLDLFKEEGSC